MGNILVSLFKRKPEGEVADSFLDDIFDDTELHLTTIPFSNRQEWIGGKLTYKKKKVRYKKKKVRNKHKHKRVKTKKRMNKSFIKKTKKLKQ